MPRVDARRATASYRRTRLVVVTNPTSPRWRSFQRAPLPANLRLALLPWQEVLAREGDLRTLDLLLDAPCVLRLDSPDNDESIARALVALAREEDAVACGAKRKFRPNEIHSPRLFFDGWTNLLKQIARSLTELPWVKPWLAPDVILQLFDKVYTREQLAKVQLPCTQGFEPTSAARMLDELSSRRWPRAYLKLRHGFAGCGLVFLDLERRRGISTVDSILDSDQRMYFVNTRRLRWRPLSELSSIMDFIIDQQATCEQAIDLAELDADPFDLRVIVIGDRAPFSVFRQNRYPITNLHLTGRRADADRCQELIGQRLCNDARDAAIEAAALFGAPVAGVDIAVNRQRTDFAILELNAFGDFFPDLVDTMGRSVHSKVLEAIAKPSWTKPAAA